MISVDAVHQAVGGRTRLVSEVESKIYVTVNFYIEISINWTKFESKFLDITRMFANNNLYNISIMRIY